MENDSDITRSEVKSLDGKSLRIYNINKRLCDIRNYPSVTAIISTTVDFSGWKKSEKYSAEITLYGTTVGTLGHYRLQSKLAQTWGVMAPPLSLSSDQRNAIEKWREFFPHARTKKEIGIKDAIEKIRFLFDDWITDYSPALPIYFNNGVKRDANINPFEINVWSDRYCYAGSIDMVTYIKKIHEYGNTLVDFKTKGEAFSEKEYRMQVIAYKMGFNEQNPSIPIDESRILYVPKDGENWQYVFNSFTKDEQKIKDEWLNTIKKFYEKYGNEYPMSKYKTRVMENLKKDGY